MIKQKIEKIKWREQCKIRIRRNASLKHETIKLYLVLNLLERHKKDLNWIRIYTEYPIDDKKICDVYFENVKSNEIIAYEIQNNVSNDWLEKTKKFYESWDKMFFKTDWILIKEDEFSNDCDEIYNKIKEYYTL